jgi:phosphoglucosamine mutase
MESFPQVLKNVRTSSHIDVSHIPQFSTTVLKMEQKLGDSGRILVRPSGTESLIRVMIEGQDESMIEAMADELCAMVSKADLG